LLRPCVVALLLLSVARAEEHPDQLAKTWAEAIENVNREHAKDPGKAREADLAARLPKPARAALESLLKMKDSAEFFDALATAGEASLELDLSSDFDRILARLAKASPDHAARLGNALSRDRLILRGMGGLDRPWLLKFAEVLEAILAAYDELYGFKEWSKVPGKKLRVRVHLEKEIVNPPHFAPQFPFHSEIDFPVADGKAFTSPTPDGKFLFYGLCHELGHVIAMWGGRENEEDHHAWAHYTGVTVVAHIAAGKHDFLKDLKDVKWRSLTLERESLKDAKRTSERDAALRLFIALHDRLGPKALGDAINWLDAQDKRLRINRVRYYTFKELREGLLATQKGVEARKAVEELLSGK